MSAAPATGRADAPAASAPAREPGPLPPAQFRFFLWFSHCVFIGGLVVSLVIRWRRPAYSFNYTDVLLVALVLLQSALYFWGFVRPSRNGKWPGFGAYGFYFAASLVIYFVEIRIDSAFNWAIGCYVGQLLALPWPVALPATLFLLAGFVLTEVGWSRLRHFSAFEWFLLLGVVSAWIMFIMFFHRALATSKERAKLIQELEAAKHRLELAGEQEAELAVMRERERLARDLHDSLGHSLVTLTVQIEAARRLLPAEPGRVAPLLAEIQKLTRSSMEDLRRSLANLRTPGLGDRPLAAAIRTVCDELPRRSGLDVSCSLDTDTDSVSPAVAEVLWRVTQEALNNIERHARARNVWLKLAREPQAVALRVTDNGVGLPAGAEDKPGHYGLRGIRERVEGVGGTLTLSGAEPGTTVEVRVPVVGASESASQ